MTGESSRRTERLLTGPEGRLSVVLALGWGALLLGRSAVPPLLPQAIATFEISSARAGLALTAMMAMHSLWQYPAGRFSDALSRVTLLVTSLVTAMLGFALLLRARTYPGLVLGVAVVGTGTGLFFSPARALLSDQYEVRLGQALGLQTTAGLTGSALAGGLATVVVARADWQAAFVVPLAAVSVVLVALHNLRTESYELGRVSLDAVDTGRRLVGRADVRRLLAVSTLRSVVNQALLGFLPLFLIQARGFKPAVANGSYALLFVVGGVAGPLAGRLSDRVRPRLVVIALLFLSAAGVGVLLFARTVSLAVSGVALLAVGTWGFPPVMQSLLFSRFSGGSAGGDFGALKLVYTGLGSVGPTALGIVVARASYGLGLASCIVGLILATGLMVTVPDG